jgi:hypothetical protein
MVVGVMLMGRQVIKFATVATFHQGSRVGDAVTVDVRNEIRGGRLPPGRF